MKKYLLSIIAILIAIGINAFTKLRKLNHHDYVMTSGMVTSPTDRVNPNNYTQQWGTYVCPAGDNAFCKIHAYDNGSLPRISQVFDAQLYNALSASEDVPEALSGKVYLKNY